jgi:hypothetical protein
MKLFAQLTKIDETQRLVYGRAVQEVVDHADEIFDYEKSKPYFQKWNADVAKATDGKSVGSLRVMHQPIVAGRLNDITFNDAEKAIDVVAHVVDDNEWKKVQAGCYTGFSIGGKYVPGSKTVEKIGDKDVTRYTADPHELSLVDVPCIPTAQFTAIKADGTSELRKFHPQSGGLTEDERAHLAKLLTEQNKHADAQKAADIRTLAAQVEEIAKAKGETVADVLKSMNIDAAAFEAALSKSASAEEGATTTTETSEAKPSAEAASIDPALKTRAEKLAKHEPAHRLLDTVRAAYGLPAVEKGLYDVADLANLLSWLKGVADCAEMEAQWEGDNSKVPEELRASVRQLGAILLDMAQEEVAELVETGEDVEVIELSAKLGDLAKGERSDGAKAALATLHEALAKALGIEPTPAPEPLTKVQRAVLDETTHALEKARTDLKDSLAKVDTLQKRVDELEKLPSAKAPVLKMVGKAGDITNVGPADGASAPDVDPVTVAGKVDDMATHIKKLHASRGQLSK